ncbi:MAG: hypothetical protein LBL13_06795 [Bacteroidales bacterium]|nr:hypothetical protein [Bacteroidales bacterium]
MSNPAQAGGAAQGQNVLDCFVPRNDGSVNVVVIHSPVIANAVKQSRRKTLPPPPRISFLLNSEWS